MLENLRSPLTGKSLEPPAAALVRAHISANTVTVIGSLPPSYSHRYRN